MSREAVFVGERPATGSLEPPRSGEPLEKTAPVTLGKTATVALALVILGVLCVLVATDLRGRAEVRRTTHTLASTHNSQARAAARLAATQAQMRATVIEVQSLEAGIAQAQTSLATTNAAISSTEQGLVLAGFDISALHTCLGGVTQALDQIAVGQTQGALASLGSVSTSCDAARPAAG